MKKSINIFWILAFFLLYPILFYKQNIGLNVLIYGVALIGFWITLFKEKATTKAGVLWLAANLICLVSVATYGSWLAFITAILVVFTTAVYFNQNNVNPITSFFASISTMVLAPFNLDNNFELPYKRKIRAKEIGLYVVIPASILVGFLLLYSMADNLFAEVLRNINLDIFTVRFVLTLMFGLLLIYTITHTMVSRKTARLEKWAGTKAGTKDRFPIKMIPRAYEETTGNITLVMLNLLLFFVILTDVRYRILGEALPAGLSHSEYLHQGIISLILSILGAILMMAWLYRIKGQNSRTLKFLSITWLVQNLVLVILNVIRNTAYINDMSLTYKRIGVYFYLLGAIIGISYTIMYVLKEQNFLHLFRLNVYSFLAILILTSPLPWDQIITRFNVQHALHKHKNIDYKYIKSLNNPDLEYLYQYRHSVLPEHNASSLVYDMEQSIYEHQSTKMLSKTFYQTHQNKLYLNHPELKQLFK